MKDKITIGRTEHGPLVVDPLKLVDSRALIQANSGGGKSYLLRGIVEQVGTKLQTIILDPEGEFATLREKVDVLLVGREGEVKTSVRGAALLARRLAELNVSAVIDLYDLKLHERREFVRDFTGALLNLPRNLWHPMLVAIDEAHVFAPERAAGESVATENIIGLASQGRKRGIGLIALTQRLSKLHKDAAAELNNVFIGRTWLPNDQARCGDLLGMDKAERLALRDMPEGGFYCFGPAIETPGISKFVSNPVRTTHPKAGERHTISPPAPSKAMQSVAAELANLPAQAEAEIKDLAAAKAEIAKLKRDLSAKPVAPVPEVKTIEKRVVTDRQVKAVESIVTRLEREGDRRIKAGEELAASGRELHTKAAEFNAALRAASAPTAPPRPVSPARSLPPARTVAMPDRPAADPASREGLTGPERKILDAVAWFEAIGVPEPEQTGVAFRAGYTFGGGGFNNPRGALNTKGLVEYVAGQCIKLTEAGRAAANFPDQPDGLEKFHDDLLKILPGPEQKLLKPLLAAYPGAMTNEQLAAASGYTAGAGGFNNPRGRLRTLGLIEYTKEGVRARDILFPPSLV